MAEIMVQDPSLLPVVRKVLAHEPLTLDDGRLLFASRDIHGIGRLAHYVRTALHGDVAYYNRNRHINYTNVCALSCKFCSFYRKRGEAGAYEMPVDQIVAAAQKAADAGATEVHIVGGLHPWLKFDYYLEFLSAIRAHCPGLHIKAFTAIEIVHFSRISKLSIRDVLVSLRDAGLGSLPGGGAEIFDERVHDQAFKGKVREDKWFEVHTTAHELGIFSNATMLYGHIEGTDERLVHMLKLRQLQQQSLDRRKAAVEAVVGMKSPMRYEAAKVKLLAPVPDPRKVVCIGLNYKDHAEESKMAIPKEPVLFSKFPTAVIGHGDNIVLPKVSTKVDYEAELVIVIGKRGRHLSLADAEKCIAGYTVGHDVSARDWQLEKDGKQWMAGKTFDTFAPCGPVIVTSDELGDPHALQISLRLNGQTLQNSNTIQMIFKANEIVAYISQIFTVEPGDLIFTGTPPGIGHAKTPPLYLKAGDVAEVEIQGIGILRNPVVGE